MIFQNKTSDIVASAMVQPDQGAIVGGVHGDCWNIMPVPAGVPILLPDGTSQTFSQPMQMILMPSGSPVTWPASTHVGRKLIEEQKDRDPTFLKITVEAPESPNGYVHIWAQVDTGSAANLITENLIKALDKKGHVLHRGHIGDETWKDYMSSQTFEKRHRDIKDDALKCADGDNLLLTEYVCLSFGTSVRRFENVIFEVLPMTSFGEEDSARNDEPDLVFGAPWLTEHSVLMMDPAFQRNMHVDQFEVLEPRPALEDQHGCRPAWGKGSVKVVNQVPKNLGKGSAKY